MNCITHKNYYRYLIGLLLFAVLFIAPKGIAHAVTETTIGEGLSLVLVPANPGPHTLTNVTLASFAADLASASISWELNGNVIKRGVGETRVSFKTGDIGSKTTLSVTVSPISGDQLQTILTIIPEQVTLLYEADTYTPQLYRGKPLPSPTSSVRITGITDFRDGTGVRINPRDLVFTWKKNFESSVVSSGTGRDSIVLTTAGPMSTLTVQLTVSSRDGALVAEKSLTIETVQPRLLLYEERPLEGVRHTHAIGESLSLDSQEIALRAEPFYLSTPRTAITVTWSMNGSRAATNSTEPFLLTLRKPDGAAGSASIGVLAINGQHIFQESHQSLSILFGQ